MFGCLSLVRALITGSGAAGVAGAVVGAVVVGVIVGLVSRKTTRDLSSLGSEQRSTVVRAVQRGEAPADPSLAEATIRRARWVQDQRRLWWAWMVLGCAAALCVALAISDAVAGSLDAGGVVLAGVWLIALPGLWWARRRVVERARRAEAAAAGQIRAAGRRERL